MAVMGEGRWSTVGGSSATAFEMGDSRFRLSEQRALGVGSR
jgi:hypothetical protein